MKIRILSIIIAVALACLLTLYGQVWAQESATSGGGQAPDAPTLSILGRQVNLVYRGHGNRDIFGGRVAFAE